MSSGEDSQHEGRKKRKVLRACDNCRRRRIKCDTLTNQKVPCTHCVSTKFACTFEAGAPKRYPPKGYIDDLEKRCEALEALLRQNLPQIQIEKTIGPKFTQENWATLKDSTEGPLVRFNIDTYLNNATGDSTSGPSNNSAATSRFSSPTNRSDLPSRGYTSPVRELESRMEKLSLSTIQMKIHRNCSNIALLDAAVRIKRTSTGPTSCPLHSFPPDRQRWESVWHERVDPATLFFPPEDIAEELVNNAFQHTLLLYPVVHRPTFDAKQKAKAYLQDIEFAQMYLLVCAIGSRLSMDERVYVRNDIGKVEWTSAGWHYFEQVFNLRRPLIEVVELGDLQIKALLGVYLWGTSAPHAAYIMAAHALLYAEDIRLSVADGARTAYEDQMWRRVFWTLVVAERLSGSALAKPIITFDGDIHAELPMPMDDEDYDPVLDKWTRSSEKPPRIAAFLQLIKLLEILCRSNLVIRKLRFSDPVSDPVNKVYVVAELDSKLAGWLDSLPDHLKWNPQQSDVVFFDQSAQLRTLYHYVHMNLHRSFIPDLTTSVPSTVVCVNSASSISKVVESYIQRNLKPPPMLHSITFFAALVLLINMWDAKKKNPNADCKSLVEDIRRCFHFLRLVEKTCLVAKVMFDITRDLASGNGIADYIPSQAVSGRKRPHTQRNATTPQSQGDQASLSQSSSPLANGDDIPGPAFVVPPLSSTAGDVAIPTQTSGMQLAQSVATVLLSDPSAMAIDDALMTAWGGLNAISDPIYPDFFGSSSVGGGQALEPTPWNAEVSPGDTLPATSSNDWDWLNDIIFGAGDPAFPSDQP